MRKRAAELADLSKTRAKRQALSRKREESPPNEEKIAASLDIAANFDVKNYGQWKDGILYIQLSSIWIFREPGIVMKHGLVVKSMKSGGSAAEWNKLAPAHLQIRKDYKLVGVNGRFLSTALRKEVLAHRTLLFFRKWLSGWIATDFVYSLRSSRLELAFRPVINCS